EAATNGGRAIVCRVALAACGQCPRPRTRAGKPPVPPTTATSNPLIEQPTLIEERYEIGLGGGFGQPEVAIRGRGGASATRGPHDEMAAEQVRLNLVGKRVHRKIHGRGQGLGARR